MIQGTRENRVGPYIVIDHDDGSKLMSVNGVEWHQVTTDGICTCPAFEKQETCKHVQELFPPSKHEAGVLLHMEPKNGATGPRTRLVRYSAAEPKGPVKLRPRVDIRPLAVRILAAAFWVTRLVLAVVLLQLGKLIDPRH